MILKPTLDIDENDSSEIKQQKISEQIAICRVKNLSDIRKLILSSERLQEDIDYYFEHCKNTPYMTLVLQEWRKFSPADEVRCFVRGGFFIAACPYHSLGQQSPDIQSLALFVKLLYNQIPHYKNFIADVFFQKGKWNLIELNPFHKITDPICFNWQDLYVTTVFLPDNFDLIKL